MKKIAHCIVFIFLLTCGVKSHAQLAVVDGALNSLMTAMGIDQYIYYAKSLVEMVNSARNTYDQLQHMIEAQKRALNNLKGIADVKSFDDFMNWQNRQLYMEREVEDRYNNLGLKIGNETYYTSDIDRIPDALRSNYGAEYWENEFTEEQREEMWASLGLSPGNYMYVKKWQQREEDFVKKIQAQGGLWMEDNQKAAEQYNRMIRKYSEENENLDANEILKNINITLIQQEMVMREMARQISEKFEYDTAMNQLGATPPNPSRLSGMYDESFFGRISEGTSRVVEER